MHLKDFSTKNSVNVELINSFLKENYGISVDTNADMVELFNLKKQIEKSYNKLRFNESKTMKDSELTKYNLILSTVNTLLKEAMIPCAETYESKVIAPLFSFCKGNVELGDEIEEAVRSAMKVFASSKYRYPTEMVEEDLLKRVRDHYGVGMVVYPEGDYEEDMMEMKQLNISKLRALLESEIDQAEVIVAAKGFAQELQGMIEKIGRMQNEDLPPVIDQMREAFGQDVALSFGNLMNLEFEEVMDEIKDAKDKMDSSITGISETGSMDSGFDTDSEMPMDNDMMDFGGDEMPMEPEDDMEPPMGDEEDFEEPIEEPLDDAPLGREPKESVNVKGKKLAEMKKLLGDVQAKLKEVKSKKQ